MNDGDHPQFEHLDGALKVLSGNRTERFTWQVDGSACQYPARSLCRFAAVPSLHDPRVLLPLDASPASLRAGLQQHARSAASPAVRLAARLLAFATTVRAAVPLMRQRVTLSVVDDGLAESPLHSFLTELLGRGDLSLSVRLAPGRPNGKPVVQVSTRDGTVLAYAKFGWERLTRSLIQNEASVLAALAEPTAETPVNIPRIIHSGPWSGLETLVVEPVPSDGRIPRAVTDIPRAALRCLAGFGRQACLRLDDSTYWRNTKERTGALAPGLPAASRELVLAAVQQVECMWGAETVVTGLKHGDWIPPNMTVLADGAVSIWDWERGEFDAPRGIDAMQFVLFGLLRRGSPGRSFVQLLQRCGSRALEIQSLAPRHVPFLATLSLLETILWFAEACQAGRKVDLDRRFPAALTCLLKLGT